MHISITGRLEHRPFWTIPRGACSPLNIGVLCGFCSAVWWSDWRVCWPAAPAPAVKGDVTAAHPAADTHDGYFGSAQGAAALHARGAHLGLVPEGWVAAVRPRCLGLPLAHRAPRRPTTHVVTMPQDRSRGCVVLAAPRLLLLRRRRRAGPGHRGLHRLLHEAGGLAPTQRLPAHPGLRRAAVW